ncbi:PRC-barrel domain-containing protein [Gorillibacterium sp. sgz5001074]|uniref:PRC-barrel domain-containing protein n=1 Tax=Gorillibacterium sp. sgz5001074 TaxID=3446695 RepID=UPI003F667BDC
MIGLPVLDYVSGRRLGTVRDVLVDRAWDMRGIVLDYASWFTSARVVEWKDVRTIGHDAVMVDGKQSVRKYKQVPGVYFLCYGKSRLKGLPLISAEGVQMGHLEDVYFSQKMEDSIIGFELSDGLLTDLQEGRRSIPVPEGAERGEDMILVPVPPSGEIEWKFN